MNNKKHYFKEYLNTSMSITKEENDFLRESLLEEQLKSDLKSAIFMHITTSALGIISLSNAIADNFEMIGLVHLGVAGFLTILNGVMLPDTLLKYNDFRLQKGKVDLIKDTRPELIEKFENNKK